MLKGSSSSILRMINIREYSIKYESSRGCGS
jgi:hypothetical protein